MIDGYAAETDILNHSVGKLELGEDVLSSDKKGVAVATAAAKKNLAETVVRIAHKALPLARNANAFSVVAQLKKNLFYILGASGLDALSRARVIRNTLVENADMLSNVKSEDIDEIDAAISAYENVQLNPKIAIENKKLQGSESIKIAYKTGAVAVQNMHDYIFGYYHSSEPELVKEFEDYMHFDSEGSRHTGISANCFTLNARTK